MNENDAMKLLADANPVPTESLAPTDPPELGAAAVTRRRLVLATVSLLALAAATVTALLTVHLSASRQAAPTNTGKGANAVAVPPEQPIPLSEASAALGAPVVLPDTPRIGPSDVGSVTKECPGPWGQTCAITIRFFLTWDSKDAAGPRYGVQIRYSLGGYANPLAEYRASVGQYRRVVYLSGVPALLITQNPHDRAGTASSYIEFQLGGRSISVVARHADDPSARSIAQSIVDRSR